MSEKVTNNARARVRKPRITFSDAIVAEILERISDGESLNKICSTEEMPSRKSFFEWVAKDPSIKDRYEIAMSLRADLMAEEILEIADDSANDVTVDPETGHERVDHEVVARAKLRVDARKWLAGKLAPKKYSEKLLNEHTGKDGESLFGDMIAVMRSALPVKKDVE